MDKAQAIHSFWAGFGLTAYDETTVPSGDDAPAFPYLTYTGVADDSFENMVAMSASLWYRSTSWAAVTSKGEEISRVIGMGGKVIPFDGGAIWITRGTPFAQRMVDDDDSIRRIYINVNTEFISQN